ncbi:class I SAM-dependent methyltransferase [Burkholderia sola]|uniref:class I SAM-dependent methyltransferase n=1 Tax=Burkholderia TaxID=32008 RepID=UPI001AEA73CD|nr:class I SAM-dependent methyltransferase [Burkholderia sp. AcTa6-5]MBP0714302.1 class I SAM-dependent methyltransferase [Burkholderia sp. AcTa6-5]
MKEALNPSCGSHSVGEQNTHVLSSFEAKGNYNYGYRAKTYHLEQCDDRDFEFYRSQLDNSPGPTLIVPCGVGRLLPLFLDRPMTYYMDLEVEMVRILKERLVVVGRDSGNALVGDMLALPRERYTNIVVQAEAIQMFDPTKIGLALSSIRGALMPGGIALIDMATFLPGNGAPSYFDVRRKDSEKWLSWEKSLGGDSVMRRYVSHTRRRDFIDFDFEYVNLKKGIEIERRWANVKLWLYDDFQFRKYCDGAGLRVDVAWRGYSQGQTPNGARLIYRVCKS